MEGKKIKFKVIKSELINNKPVFECEEVETGEKVLLKKNPKLETKLSYGKQYFFIINENWINYAELLDVEETPKISSEETKSTISISPYEHKQDLILAQSSLKEAVQLAIHIETPGTTNDLLIKVKEIHKDLFNYMKKEGYK